jgi:RTX calcium-binding nonapeptide repeat (4 copies)
MNRRLTRIALVAALVTVGGLAASSSASATFDLNKIREITGDTVGGDQSYIELQMYAAGQNFVAGHNITVWDADALVLGMPVPIQTHTLTGPNPPNGANQSTILIGDTNVAGRDFTIPELSNYLDNTVGGNLMAAGAICFEAIPVDCVSWGGSNFTGASRLPDQTTPNGSTMPTGLLALQRNIGGNCATALDAADDTNNAGADFSLVGANPRPNSVTPTETLCAPPGGGGGSGAGGGGGGGATPQSCAGKTATITGTAGNNALTGTPAADVIAGLGGKDTLRGVAGNDTICGGAGKDRLLGGKGNDKLLGQGGGDTLKGGAGKDRLKGGPGKDTQIQ